MDTTTADHAFFVTCPRNTEGLLLDELRSLGADDAAETRAGVRFTGPLPLAYRICLWSRVAGRVLLRLAAFPVTKVEDIYPAIHDLPWEDHLLAGGTLAVEVTSAISQGPLASLNTHFAEQRVKDAVVDRFRERVGSRPGVDLAKPDLRINLHLAPTEAVLSIDLSGDGLHRRGYRLEGGEAPLKENLAAAVLLRAEWPRLAASGATLLDPMCGSGTLLVEGAWIAGDVAPGLMRQYYGFLGWRAFDSAPWQELIEEAQQRREQGLSSLPPIYGFDLEQKAVGTARANARRAGLAGRVVLQQRGLQQLVAPSVGEGGGLVITNPPYGKRLGDVEALVPTYETLGEKLKASFSGWQAAVLTGNAGLGAHLGLRAHRVNTLYNGPLECKLLQFYIGGLPVQAGAAQGATPSQGAPGGLARDGAAAEMFANRLRKNQKHLRGWLSREAIQCYRVYDADLPEYSLAVDVYGAWVHVQEYAPPSTVDPVRARRRLKAALAVIPEALGVSPDQVLLKVRSPQKGAEQYRKLDDRGNFLQVTEAGLHFLVNLTDYLDTGLFLDHRLTRALIRDAAAGKRFLNLFAYTGSATVYAAAGDAATTTTVDLSPTYLDWARRNLDLNGYSGPEHSFIRADCLEWLVSGTTRPASYDLVFMDAPTFSNSKSMEQTLDIQRDHARLVRAAMRLLAKQGALLFSTNFRRFKLDADLEQEFSVLDISKQTLPPDFSRNARIHRCFRITQVESQDPQQT